MSEWISAKDRLPEYGQKVLVYPSSYFVTLDKHGWTGNNGSMAGITHWMPLPEPPK